MAPDFSLTALQSWHLDKSLVSTTALLYTLVSTQVQEKVTPFAWRHFDNSAITMINYEHVFTLAC